MASYEFKCGNYRATICAYSICVRFGAIGSLCQQIEDLAEIAHQINVRLTHVKAHGALYNLAATDSKTAGTIIESVLQVDTSLSITGLAGSQFLIWCEEAGVRIISEAFANRRYEENGSLRTRQYNDALITDASEAAHKAIQIGRDRLVTTVCGRQIPVHADSLCLHGDSPNALLTAKAVRAALTKAGVLAAPICNQQLFTSVDSSRE